MAKSERFSLFDTKKNWFISLAMLSVALISLLLMTNLIGSQTSSVGKAAKGTTIIMQGFGLPGTPTTDWDEAIEVLKLLRSDPVSGGGAVELQTFSDGYKSSSTYYTSFDSTAPVEPGVGYVLVYNQKSTGNPSASLRNPGNLPTFTYALFASADTDFGNVISIPEGVEGNLDGKYAVSDLCIDIDQQSSQNNAVKIGRLPARGITGTVQIYNTGLQPNQLEYYDCQTRNGVNFSIDAGVVYFVFTNQASRLTLPN